MTGVLDGVDVLDLSQGIGGPIAGMLLADHGARVTKIEPPDGDATRKLSGAQVWHRGKRSAYLDIEQASDRRRLISLAKVADVLIESFSPGTTDRLGVDFDTLHSVNPRLIYCSITGYGDNGRHSKRPPIDALVAARTGHQWESRGVDGGSIARLSGVECELPDLETPADCRVGAPRPGPLFSGVPWVSLAVAYQATLAISTGLHVRETTGRGQHVATSMLQGVLATTQFAWQRVECPDTDNYQSWIIDSRAPKGLFRCADGRWIHQWVPLPEFILPPSGGDRLERTPDTKSPKQAATRIGTESGDIILLHHFQPALAAAIAKFSSDEWVDLAADVGVPLQPLRSPEEALHDPLFLDDGCVITVTDPERGPVRQVGRVYELHACPADPPRPPSRPGADTATVLREADALTSAPPRAAASGSASPRSPLADVRVLDLGLAVAGPWGTMMLADLGADVIKVSGPFDKYWMSSHMAMSCNRGKRSISLDFKKQAALDVFYELVATADIVQHNMRYDAAVRLGVDFDSLRSFKPDLIYCHTRGFELGPRVDLPGNDQTGAALAGPDWLDGGLDHGGVPLWPSVSLGDTGCGFLSAIAMVQALFHRDRTGEGQFVDTSIMYAHLLNASMAWDTPDGLVAPPRPSLDRMQLGWSPWYRLYDTADGWLCVAACHEHERRTLARVLDVDLASISTVPFNVFDEAFRSRTALQWFELLDDAGVPAEVSDPTFVLDLFDDSEMIERGWVTSYEHPKVGKMDVFGRLIDFSETPGIIQGPPYLPGQHSTEILEELGMDPSRIETLFESGAVAASEDG